jgi:hypothetical protein
MTISDKKNKLIYDVYFESGFFFNTHNSCGSWIFDNDSFTFNTITQNLDNLDNESNNETDNEIYDNSDDDIYNVKTYLIDNIEYFFENIGF